MANQTDYLFSRKLEVFGHLAVTRMKIGAGAVLLLTGEPGGGKTEFASAIARSLDAGLHKYQCAPDRERDLLYTHDIQGIVTRENAWLKGPAWEAFEASARGEFSVLLIDEADKTLQAFDAFLLELLEKYTFRSPLLNEKGESYMVQGVPEKVLIIITSNGRRAFRPEVLRRAQRIQVPFPERPRLDNIIQGIANSVGVEIPLGLLELVIRIGQKIRVDNVENAPSPKEMAYCCMDLMIMGANGIYDPDVWREVAASYMIKDGGPPAIDRACRYKWARGLLTEVNRPRTNTTDTFDKKYPAEPTRRKKKPS